MTRLLVIDNYDSFVYNIAQYMGELGAECTVVRNDKTSVSDIAKEAYDAIIISPGPGTPEDARYFGICTDVIRGLGPTTPILGVCLGHQGIIHAFGGAVVNAGCARHGKTSPVGHSGTGVFAGVPTPFRATRYHSLVGDRTVVPDALEVTARRGGRRGDHGREAQEIPHRGRPVPPRVHNDRARQGHPCKLSGHGPKGGGEGGEDMNTEEIIGRVCAGGDLDCAQAEHVAGAMLDGETSHEQNAKFLGCMSAKGETDAELASMLGVMMQRAVRLQPNVRGPIIDVCGTGGDMHRTFNVSTAASFVAAARVVARLAARQVFSRKARQPVIVRGLWQRRRVRGPRVRQLG